MGCVKPLVSQPNLHQIQLSGTFLESSGRADFETAIDFNIWPRFEGVIEVSLGDNWNPHCCIYLNMYLNYWALSCHVARNAIASKKAIKRYTE